LQQIAYSTENADEKGHCEHGLKPAENIFFTQVSSSSNYLQAYHPVRFMFEMVYSFSMPIFF